jgi:hypothetical protein
MLKDDPEMINLIYNIPRANHGEQRKDNDINVTKYLEFNKDKILNLIEKHYENLLEALTNNTISSTTKGEINYYYTPHPWMKGRISVIS